MSISSPRHHAYFNKRIMPHWEKAKNWEMQRCRAERLGGISASVILKMQILIRRGSVGLEVTVQLWVPAETGRHASADAAYTAQNSEVANCTC